MGIMEGHGVAGHKKPITSVNVLLGGLLAVTALMVPSWIYSTESYVYFRFLITDFFDTAFRLWNNSMDIDIVDLVCTVDWLLRSILLAACAGLALATVIAFLAGKTIPGSHRKSRELLPWVVSIYTISASTGVAIWDYISLAIETGGVFSSGAFGLPPQAFAMLAISMTMLIINWIQRRTRP
jgi:hypothetical protein